MLRPFVAALAVTAALLATACGAEDAGDVAAGTYAQTVCSGLVGWRDGIAADSAELGTDLGKASDVATVRARYTRFFAGTVRRTDRLLGIVRDAGAPDVDRGLGHARDLTAALDRTRTASPRRRRSSPRCRPGTSRTMRPVPAACATPSARCPPRSVRPWTSWPAPTPTPG